MKTQNTLYAIFSAVLLLLLFTACNKEVIKPGPVPGKDSIPGTIEKAFFNFVANADLTGQPYHSSNLKAVVTITNQKGEEIIRDKMLSVILENKVITQSIELPIGSYQLTGFRLEYGSVYTHFAAPRTGSIKAASVQKPLAFAFTVEKNSPNSIPVEVLKVQEGEKPGQYGYPSGAFDYGQEDANPYLKIKLKAIMQIGDVIYDSVPASLTLSTYASNGDMTTAYVSLKAGVNEIPLLKSAAKYHFRISRWGISDTMTLDRTHADEVTVYTMGGSRQAKKLKSEIVLRQVNGVDVAESKTNYRYNADDNLYLVEYWLKRKDNTPYLAMTDRFEFNGKRVATISRYDEETKTLLSTTSFSYDNQGKVTAMSRNENNAVTRATVSYDYTTPAGFAIHYDNPGDNDLDYQGVLYRGNMIASEAYTTNGNYEKGQYDYDVNINHYRHMNWPDFYFSRSSANNKTMQYKQYYGAYPVNDPYSFSYTYDGEGYPKEMITQYKNYMTGKFLFSTKTIFAY